MNPLLLPLSSFRRKVILGFQTSGAAPGTFPIEWAHLNTPWFSDFLQEQKLTGAPPADFHFTVQIEPQDGLYVAEIQGAMRPKLECIRSLTEFTETVEIKDRCYFVSEKDTASHTVVSDSLLESYTFEGDHIDLKEFLLDSLYNSMPTHPLCKPDCKGLCNECGANLNDIFKCPQAEDCGKINVSIH
jgi:uncharacterized protein